MKDTLKASPSADEAERSTVASERIADTLAERILSGALAPGARIKQDTLASELNTSRIPVRDALWILEKRGLITIRANAGARVASMTRRDLETSYEMRERIEPLLLGESIPQLSDTDIAELKRIQQAIEATSDVTSFLRLDRQFHWTTYKGHRVPQLALIIERLWDTTQNYRRAHVQLTGDEGARLSSMEHRLLIEAIEGRDVETASAVLALHIRRTRVTLRERGHLGEDEAN